MPYEAMKVRFPDTAMMEKSQKVGFENFTMEYHEKHFRR
jgi:hypothetical protein